MAASYSSATELSVRSHGRDPVWREIVEPATAPTSTISGVALDRAVRTLVRVGLRETPSARTARVTFDPYTPGAHAVTIGGHLVARDSTGEDLNAHLQAWAAAINANPDAGAIVEAEAQDDNGAISVTDAVQLRIRGLTAADFSIVGASPADSATFTADLVGAFARPWWRAEGRSGTVPFDGWEPGKTVRVTSAGWLRRFDTGGIARGAIECPAAARVLHPDDGAAIVGRAPELYLGPGLEL